MNVSALGLGRCFALIRRPLHVMLVDSLAPAGFVVVKSIP